jgi:FkbM family methyltransferase
MNTGPTTELTPRPSKTLQWIADRTLRHNGPVARRLFGFLRNALAARLDGAVRHTIAGHEVLLPLSHQLPDYRAKWLRYDTALPQIAATLARRSGKDLVVIDIGANVGDTAVPLLTGTELRLIAVEGNPAFLGYLRHNLAGFGARAAIVPAFAAAAHDPGSSYRIETHSGTARLVKTQPSSDVPVEFLGLPQIVSRAGYGRPDLVKIDTDGFDVPILFAALEWLEEVRPTLFFEFDPALAAPHVERPWEVFARLAAAGYAHGIVYLNTGEYCRSVRLDDQSAMAELAALLQAQTVAYFDIAAFCNEDDFAAFRESELSRFAVDGTKVATPCA